MRAIVRGGLDATRRIEQEYVTVQALVGKRPNYGLPTETDFRNAAEARLKELDDMLEHAPMTLDQCRNALTRIINGLPPSDRGEQFRDALLWETILQVGTSADILFASEDPDFFCGHDRKQGLAPHLAHEIKHLGGTISAFADLASLVAAIQHKVPPPEYPKLASAISGVILPELRQYAEQRQLALGDLVGHDVLAYLTEQKDVLALTFELRYRILPTQEEDQRISPESAFHVSGNCFYHTVSESVREVSLDKIQALDNQGRLIPGTGTLYLHARSAVLGPRWIPYELRTPIAGQE